jgi:RNA polymerase sigma-70 factor, ECF subfamily
MRDKETHTARLSRDIDAAYEAYTPGDPQLEKALYKALRAQAANMVWNRPGLEAPTLINDIVHRAMVGLKTFRGDSRVSTWFFALAQHEVDRALRDLIQKRKRFESLTPDDEDSEEETSQPDLPAKPVNEHAKIDLDKAREGLPVKQDEVVQLVLEGNSLAEVAQRLGIPLGTIRSRYRLAKGKMARRARKKKSRQ